MLCSSIIIDSGALVRISLHRSDFVTYKNNKMKIKDLSSLNQVAGEEIISWSLQDVNGKLVQLELIGYHIPNAEVPLLSPQKLIKAIGSHALQTATRINVVLDNGKKLLCTILSTKQSPNDPSCFLEMRGNIVSGIELLIFQLTVSATSMPLNVS